MAAIIHKTTWFRTRTELVKHLLLQKKLRKSKIAKIANVKPQTVESVYKDLVRYDIIDDYYSSFINNKKTERLLILNKKKERRKIKFKSLEI